MKKLLTLALSLWFVAMSYAATANHVTQYEMTWNFDKAYTVGQFANGDWWVLGPVTITNITPTYHQHDFWDFTSDKGTCMHWINGWQVNPVGNQMQGFDATHH
jgi:hypothetical protein